MTKRKTSEPTELLPHFMYRQHSAFVQNLTGASPGQISRMIRLGELPKPKKLFRDGRAVAFSGEQLIQFMKERESLQ